MPWITLFCRQPGLVHLGQEQESSSGTLPPGSGQTRMSPNLKACSGMCIFPLLRAAIPELRIGMLVSEEI
jgi:hypothetical protein